MSRRTDKLEIQAMKDKYNNLTVRWNGKEITGTDLSTAASMIGVPMRNIARTLDEREGVWRTLRFEVEAGESE